MTPVSCRSSWFPCSIFVIFSMLCCREWRVSSGFRRKEWTLVVVMFKMCTTYSKHIHQSKKAICRQHLLPQHTCMSFVWSLESQLTFMFSIWSSCAKHCGCLVSGCITPPLWTGSHFSINCSKHSKGSNSVLNGKEHYTLHSLTQTFSWKMFGALPKQGFLTCWDYWGKEGELKTWLLHSYPLQPWCPLGLCYVLCLS